MLQALRTLTIAVILAWATSALANCTTHTISYPSGRFVVCTTCCFGTSCTTSCF